MPFPSTQIENDKPLVLVGVDVVKQANGCPFELEVDVFSWVLLGNVKQSLEKNIQNTMTRVEDEGLVVLNI